MVVVEQFYGWMGWLGVGEGIYWVGRVDGYFYRRMEVGGGGYILSRCG